MTLAEQYLIIQETEYLRRKLGYMSVEVGQKVQGKVTGITNFGAFVELPDNKSGLVHISEISDSYVKDINDVLTMGQEIEVRVLSIAPDGKISLSLRQANESSESKSAPRTNRDGFQSQANHNRKPKFESKDNNYNQNKSFKPSTRPSNSDNYSKPKETPKADDFDALMSSFLKDSEDRLSSLRRNTEGKRGGRGGRRN